MDKSYWEDYYLNHRQPAGPSTFAEFCIQHLDNNGKLVELGCGNGRDSVFFSKEAKVIVRGVDQCQKEVAFLNENYKNNNLSFECMDFTKLPTIENSLDYLYSRFTLHSIKLEEENRTLAWCYTNLKPGGKLMLEVRSVKDELFGQGLAVEDSAFITDHYRRFANYDNLLKRLEELNFNIEYSVEDKGLAIYKKEDPVVIRIIAKKRYAKI